VVVLIGALGCSGSDAVPEMHAARAPARWLCDSRARREISQSLGAEVRIGTPRRQARRTSCTYTLPTGTITVSVTRHRTPAGAREQLAAITRERGRRPEPPMFGEGLRAFATTDGSVVVRRGDAVLDVDAAQLPRFGQPAQSPATAARAVAGTLLTRWVPE
jgi:hypothetical protein